MTNKKSKPMTSVDKGKHTGPKNRNRKSNFELISWDRGVEVRSPNPVKFCENSESVRFLKVTLL